MLALFAGMSYAGDRIERIIFSILFSQCSLIVTPSVSGLTCFFLAYASGYERRIRLTHSPVMAFDPVYHEETLSRDELNRIPGAVLVEFGANWCGICRGFTPILEELFTEYPDLRHIRVEDGRGKPLGRSFRVKLWPTLVFMRDGNVVRQIARPGRQETMEGLMAIASEPS